MRRKVSLKTRGVLDRDYKLREMRANWRRYRDWWTTGEKPARFDNRNRQRNRWLSCDVRHKAFIEQLGFASCRHADATIVVMRMVVRAFFRCLLTFIAWRVIAMRMTMMRAGRMRRMVAGDRGLALARRSEVLVNQAAPKRHVNDVREAGESNEHGLHLMILVSPHHNIIARDSKGSIEPNPSGAGPYSTSSSKNRAK